MVAKFQLGLSWESIKLYSFVFLDVDLDVENLEYISHQRPQLELRMTHTLISTTVESIPLSSTTHLHSHIYYFKAKKARKTKQNNHNTYLYTKKSTRSRKCHLIPILILTLPPQEIDKERSLICPYLTVLSCRFHTGAKQRDDQSIYSKPNQASSCLALPLSQVKPL